MDNIIAEVTRGSIVENVVRGHIAVINGEGKLLASVGDPCYYTYMRSTAKPLQASFAVECGACDAFSLEERELAILCSSHMGEAYHVEVLEGILKKLSLEEDALTLGEDLSFSPTLREERLIKGIKPRKLYNNCSGKHLAMLACCRYMGWDHSAYQKPEHPVQQNILSTVAEYTEMNKAEITIGIDGCGVPVFAMPLKNMAVGYKNFSIPEQTGLSPARIKAAGRLKRAMKTFPQLVSGWGTFTTDIMKDTDGRVLAKLGADGVYCVAVEDCDLYMALKIEDGNGNMVPPVVINVLKQFDALTYKEEITLSGYKQRDNINCQNEVVGRIRSTFSL